VLEDDELDEEDFLLIPPRTLTAIISAILNPDFWSCLNVCCCSLSQVIVNEEEYVAVIENETEIEEDEEK